MAEPKDRGNGAVRIGVYICHCGTNIAGVVDVRALTEYAAALPRVAVARDYKYMCSDPGQELIKEDIRQHNLDRIVVAACSPLLHERTFRQATAQGGLNPFYFQMVNIREHDAWVHEDRKAATEKAKDLIRAAARRVVLHRPLERRQVPVRSDVLVVGGGIAGIHAALTLANAGKRVYLVEREPTIGGHMAKFDKTFPTLDCAACILTPKMTAVKTHPNISLWTLSEVTQVEGYVGNYKVTVKRKPRYVLEDVCVGCYECIEACVYKDARHPDEFNLGLGKRKPIYIPFPQAVPLAAVIDPETCIAVKTGKCKRTCIEVCGERNAIDLEQKEDIKEIEVGTIILSTGFKAFDAKRIPYYGYGVYPNVYTALEVERLVNAAGPTGGEVLLRGGRKPESVAIVHCVGSRDENTNRYCSRVCCMYSLKLAHLIQEKTGAEVYNFYIDIRAPDGREFVRFPAQKYLDYVAEHVEAWSYVKFCYLKPVGWKGFAEGPESGVYAVAPLARLNAADGMATPKAQEAYEEFYSALRGRPVHHTLANHWARVVEMVYAAERMNDLLNDPDITSKDLRVIPTQTPTVGIGVVEAPRGTLFHHYETDEKGLIRKVNLIVATQNNAARIAMSVEKAAKALIHNGDVSEGLLNMVEMAFRAYDPCHGCATHALPGSMPLLIRLCDRQGNTLTALRRDLDGSVHKE